LQSYYQQLYKHPFPSNRKLNLPSISHNNNIIQLRQTTLSSVYGGAAAELEAVVGVKQGYESIAV
jgi:hypothetical protein